MAGGGDPGGTVNVGADVALAGQQRRPGMEPHPHGDRECLLRLARGGQRPGRGREGNEEGVALRVHLDASVAGERLAQDRAVLGELVRVRLGTELVQQPRGALDVREEERDRSAGELGHAR